MYSIIKHEDKNCHLSYKVCRSALQIGSRFCFQLLLKPKFSGIEKIKTIGSTYMLASGLRPGKEDGMGVSFILLLSSKLTIILAGRGFNPKIKCCLHMEIGCINTDR
jgi:hypothetical protein